MNQTTETETIEVRRKRLSYRSWHRGTREMDLILGRFSDENIEGFNTQELDQYEDLLEHNDPDLYNWISGREQVPANFLTPVLEKLLKRSS